MMVPTCPTCKATDVSTIYELANVPTNSVLLLSSEREALDFPKGEIKLAFCQTCGFIWNDAFESQLTEYSGRYESTQAYSPTFTRFQELLARDLVEGCQLRSKKLVEIGCGSGEFLTLLCRLGGNQGVGYDPAFDSDRHHPPAEVDVRFIADFYTDQTQEPLADFYCCKMTLEHIAQPAEFIAMIRRAIGNQPQTQVFFQVPNAQYVFGDLAFWDVYYEHCSYFTLGSLARVFRQEGFAVTKLWSDYDNQYIMILAQPTNLSATNRFVEEDDLQLMKRAVDRFTAEMPRLQEQWEKRFQSWAAQNRRIVLWGGGSKAVAFLTLLQGSDLVQFVVDINPHKADTYLPVTGQQIVTPDFLHAYQPDIVIIMNPIYRPEISRSLANMGLAPEILTV